MLIAKHKITGKTFKDYKNISGCLTSYIKEINPEIEIPSKFLRNKYHKENNIYLYEKYFDILDVDNNSKKNIKELTENDISDIIRLYKTNEISSTHKLAEVYKVGHKRISQILKDNNVNINQRGGQKKYEEITVKYINRDGFIFKAIHKDDGVILDDYNNASGGLTKYLNQNYPEIITPKLDSEKIHYFNETGNYWYEQYFDIKEFKCSDLGLKKCPYCDKYIDVSISDRKYKNHLIKEHQVDISKHVINYPNDITLFKKDIKRKNEEKDKNNWIKCEICGEKMKIVNNKHLSKHDITVKEYKVKYGFKTTSENTHNKLSKIGTMGNLYVKKNYTSKPENEIKNYLTSIGVKYESNRQILIGKEIDILSNEYKIGIEFNGNKWHTEWFGKKDKTYHLDKTIKCNLKNYRLLHIFEDEWVLKQDIVKNKLKYLFDKDSEMIKISGRKIQIKIIDKPTQIKFLDKYHIQGNGQSTISIGGFFNDELISVMLFKKTNKNSDNYDLTRYATNYNYIYQGVASKMLKYFERNYNPESIISFADRRWTLDKDNNLYTKLGFELDNITSPNCWYYNEKVDKHKRFHNSGFKRQTLHKKYGLPLTMTKTEMVKELGYDRIWDCGLFKYVKKYN